MSHELQLYPTQVLQAECKQYKNIVMGELR